MAGCTLYVLWSQGHRTDSSEINPDTQFRDLGSFPVDETIMVASLSFLVLVGLFQFGDVIAWLNDYDKELTFECTENQYVSEIKSQHSNRYEDRQWEYACRALPSGVTTNQCKWYRDVNEMNELLAFRCMGSQVVTGVTSRHDNHYEDRVFGFRCCDITKFKLENCLITSFINNYDGFMNYILPHDYVIIGMDSEHDNRYQDRRWKLEICQVINETKMAL